MVVAAHAPGARRRAEEQRPRLVTEGLPRLFPPGLSLTAGRTVSRHSELLPPAGQVEDQLGAAIGPQVPVLFRAGVAGNPELAVLRKPPDDDAAGAGRATLVRRGQGRDARAVGELQVERVGEQLNERGCHHGGRQSIISGVTENSPEYLKPYL